MTIVRTPVVGPGAGPYAVVVDADLDAWATLVHSGQLARLSPDGRVQLRELGSSVPARLSWPSAPTAPCGSPATAMTASTG
jgi:hypothetical protein